jgi:hypothetical protein
LTVTGPGGSDTKEVIKQRKEWMEPLFGTMKRRWDHGYFLMRGLEEVERVAKDRVGDRERLWGVLV